MRTQKKLLQKYMPSAPTGKVEWIGLRPDRKAPMLVADVAVAVKDQGLEGDRQASKSNGSARQVTLICAEDVAALANLLKMDEVDPQLLRRNIVISGLNLHPLRYSQIQIGEAVLEIGAHCHPCMRMEQALGSGAVLAMYGRGGYCAKVVKSGQIKLADSVSLIRDEMNG